MRATGRYLGVLLCFAPLLIMWLVLAPAVSQAAPPGPEPAVRAVEGAPAGGSSAPAVDAVRAQAAIYVLSISKLDLRVPSFDATFYFYVRCERECSPDGWELMNGKVTDKSLQADTPTLKVWRVTASFSFDPNFRLYPFDGQSLPIVIEHSNLTIGKMIYVPYLRYGGVDPAVTVPGWEIGQFSFTESLHHYVPFDETYSQLRFSVPLSRSTLASISKNFVPLIIVVLLGVSTLVLARNDMQLRTGGTALLALTLFYLASTSAIPSVGYLTLWDEAVVLGYILLFLVLLCGAVGSYLYGEDKFEGEAGKVLNKRMRFWFAIAIGVLATGGSVIIVLTA
jgi:hypothetical protein